MALKLEYNAPVVLTYAFLSGMALLLSQIFGPGLMQLFTVYDFSFSSPVTYFQLFSHVAGHGDWNHLLGNFSFILILGPILEERYGSKNLLMMILITALVTGLLHVLFYNAFSDGRLTGLLGASGVVFMMIILSGFMSFKSGKIPLTLVLIVLLYIGKEISASFQEDNISQFAHIIGGIMGGIFGYLLKERKQEGGMDKESIL